jgi:charged multivesicular body protein 6
MEDTAEAVQFQQEISAVLARQGIAEDDQELLKELEALDAEEEEVSVELPSVPKKAVGNREVRQKVVVNG